MTSISFDRAAAFYDRTRVTEEDAVRGSVDLLAAELVGPILEIGVGTGALAVPLAARGAPVVGADISAAMLARLRDKTRVVPVVQADATRLPFADGAFGGAFARHVLHLISEWRSAVAELCRVVRPGGTVLIEPGGFAGEWRTVWRRFIDELGPDARPVGLDVATHGIAQLDEAFEAAGASARGLPAVPLRTDGSLETFLREASDRAYSWTWRVSDEVLARAVPTVRAWAEARYGDLTVPFEPDAQMRWRAYDLPPGPDADRP